MADIGSLMILLPPKQEQDEIVAAVVAQTASLDIAVSRLEREIELLREYRTRLVADVVTGKLDVREAASRIHDEATPNIIDYDDDILDTEAVVEEAAA
jgi:type I restriction enzyme S subunit